MSVVKNLLLPFILCYLLQLEKSDAKCLQSTPCGNHFSMEFPLTDIDNPKCGIFTVARCDLPYPPKIHLGGGFYYNILKSYSVNKFLVVDPEYQAILRSNSTCFSLRSVIPPMAICPFVTFMFSPNITLFTCPTPLYGERNQGFEKLDSKCDDFTSTAYYYKAPGDGDPTSEEESRFVGGGCTPAQLPIDTTNAQDTTDLLKLLTAEFDLGWNVSEDCLNCYHGGGECLVDNTNKFYCRKENRRPKLILVLPISGAVALLLLLAVAYILRLRKKKTGGGYLFSRTISYYPSAKSDVEGGSFFGIPIFSYTELEAATNSFDPSKELGDGGFGTVYYGKLCDGREVAIKRLYEHNYKRVEQFMNEIKILTGLRHPNLVSLYGCTSRRSRELLLVYEYIPNGTVADHLHGDRAKEAPMTWPVRMSIAIETATALAYLHKSDIIHRDVKTNNILLDSNYCVKVADFGLSRLFPTDVTHISTAPQGTPGYVDPEYHQCYQLTDKSDVYSFGVVLIELISSMPAVDISRHRHEINLANLAVNRIQRSAFDELIDKSLGYDSDAEVTRMTTTVAELAFRCLQLEKDMRPSMDEVLVILKDIQAGEDCNTEIIRETNGKIPPSPESDDAVLLKNKNYQSSPTAVTDRWTSSGSTTASSIGQRRG